MPSEPKLLPCPFCGSAAAYWQGVLCTECGARIALAPPTTVDNHYAAWNRRASPLMEEAATALLLAIDEYGVENWDTDTFDLPVQKVHDASNYVRSLLAKLKAERDGR